METYTKAQVEELLLRVVRLYCGSNADEARISDWLESASKRLSSPPSEASEQKTAEQVFESYFPEFKDETMKDFRASGGYQLMMSCMKEYASQFTRPSVVTQSEKGDESHRRALKVLEAHLGDRFYETGNLHDNISNAMHEFAQEYSLLERSRVQTNLNHAVAIINKCQQTFEKLADIFDLLNEAEESQLQGAVKSVDIDFRLIVANIKDHLEKLKSRQ